MEFRLLGPLEVAENGRSLPLGRGKQRALLGLLLLRANEVVAQETLVDELWGESPPSTALTALHGYVSRLRRLLGSERVQTRPPGYVLLVEPNELDLHRFEGLVEGKRYREALELWRGPALGDLAFEPFAQLEIGRLEELRLAALESRIEEDLAQGRHAELVGELESLVEQHPLRERLAAQLMLALYRSGRQAEALEVYRETRRRLVEQLGIEPAPALQELNRAILVQDTKLEAAPPEQPAPAPEREKRAAPGYSTSFVGRKRERRELTRLLRAADTSLVTLAGPGGTGKTRLALEVARELGPAFNHGTVVVDLTAVSDPELVASTISGRLGLRDSPGRGAVEALAAFLGGRQTLLVLDNFEQVLAAAPLLAELIERAPGPTLLVTSRAPLRLPSERVYSVPPLELPDPTRLPPLDRLRRLDAVRLFVERARQARADFELSAVNADAVAELCVRLDGLPLALELAAARVRLLSPRAIVDRLGRRLDLLRTEAPDQPERHRTLRAAIEWSYDLLAESEQRLFTCLGVFVGGFTLDGADAVGGTLGLDVLEGVESLLDNNLLRTLPTAGDEPRFGMLETIREYAAQRLATSGEAEDVRRRHGSYYLVLAEAAEPQLRGPRQAAWLERLDAENDNLRAALEWATENGEVELGVRGGAGLWRFWQTRSLNGEGRERLELLLALEAPNVAPALRADGLAAAGRLAFVVGDYEVARRHLEESLAVHREAGTVPWTAMTVTILGAIAGAQGDDRSAQSLVEESVELARASRDWWSQSVTLSILGDHWFARGELGSARRALEESLRASREAGDLRQVGRVLSNLGLVALAEQEHERAQHLFDEGLAVQRRLGDAWNITRSLDHLGVVAEASGDRAGAARLFSEALAMQAEADDRTGMAYSLELLAGLAVSDGRARRAVRLLSAAGMLRDDVGVFPMSPLNRKEPPLGELRARLGDERFKEAWARGRSLMLAEVVAYALEDEAGEPDLELASPLPSPAAQE